MRSLDSKSIGAGLKSTCYERTIRLQIETDPPRATVSRADQKALALDSAARSHDEATP